MSKFFWAVKTFEGPVSVDAFCRLYEMHPQTRKICLDDGDQIYSAQSGCCSFHPRRANKTQKIERVELSFCQKNKWEDDWVQYWFYAKIGFPDPEGSSEEIYPLASEIEDFDHTYQPGFIKHSAEL